MLMTADRQTDGRQSVAIAWLY